MVFIFTPNCTTQTGVGCQTQPTADNQGVYAGLKLTISKVAKCAKEFFPKLLRCVTKPFRGKQRLVVDKRIENEILAEVYRDPKFQLGAPVQAPVPENDWVIIKEHHSWDIIEPAPAEPAHQRWQYFRSDSMEFIRAMRENTDFGALEKSPDELRALHANFDSFYKKEFNDIFSNLHDKTPDEAISADLLEVGKSAIDQALVSIPSPEYKEKMKPLSYGVFAAMKTLKYSPKTHIPTPEPVLVASAEIAPIDIASRVMALLTLR
jgi:hypothetical protein